MDSSQPHPFVLQNLPKGSNQSKVPNSLSKAKTNSSKGPRASHGMNINSNPRKAHSAKPSHIGYKSGNNQPFKQSQPPTHSTYSKQSSIHSNYSTLNHHTMQSQIHANKSPFKSSNQLKANRKRKAPTQSQLKHHQELHPSVHPTGRQGQSPNTALSALRQSHSPNHMNPERLSSNLRTISRGNEHTRHPKYSTPYGKVPDKTREDNARIFISNLPGEDFSEEEILAELQERCGPVIHTLWFASRMDGKFYGSGLIRFANPEDAERALQLNGATMFDRTVRIERSRCPDPIRKKPPGCCTIYLNNLSKKSRRTTITKHFRTLW